MKKTLIMFIGIFMFSLFHVISPAHIVKAATFENGTYDVSLELKESGSNNASIAAGYFSKSAKLIVKNGVNYVQLTATESDWIKSISGPNGGATVISESGNTRTVQFEAGDLSGPVNLKMHVVVPEEVAGMKYDNHHSVRAVLNTSSVPTASTAQAQPETTTEVKTESTTEPTAEAGDKTTAETGTQEVKAENKTVENPKTGDTSSIWLYVSLLVGSISILALYKTRLAKN